jgi:hypothetical protein
LPDSFSVERSLKNSGIFPVARPALKKDCMDSMYVKCGVCGNQLPASFVRQRGFVTCSCGLRIDSVPDDRGSHHLRNFLFLFLTALLITVAATIGRHFLG